MVERLGRTLDYLWTVDPIDGTTNFVNELPQLFAALNRRVAARATGRRGGLVLALGKRCSRPGVYHPCVGSKFRF